MTTFFPNVTLLAGATFKRTVRTKQASATLTPGLGLLENASTFPFLQALIHRIPLTTAGGTTFQAGINIIAGTGKFN